MTSYKTQFDIPFPLLLNRTVVKKNSIKLNTRLCQENIAGKYVFLIPE